jgi:hypothetical protein
MIVEFLIALHSVLSEFEMINIVLIYLLTVQIYQHWWKKSHWSRFVRLIGPGWSNRD